jgi:hypothetical protein
VGVDELKKLVQEVLEEQEQEATNSAEEVKAKLIDNVRNLSGVQPDEIDIIEFLNNLISLAKVRNINTSSLRRALALVKREASAIAK